MDPPFHGFPFQAHPSVPLVLAFPVSQTDVFETDDLQTAVAETEDPETDVAETEVPETDNPETDVAETHDPPRRWVWFVNILYVFSGCDCLISFEQCVWTSDA